MEKNAGRKNRLVVTLDDRENRILIRKSDITGLRKSDYVRELIMGYCPTQAPGKEFYEAYEEMKNRSSEINHIASEAVMRGCFRNEDIDNIVIIASRMEYLLMEIKNIVMSARPMRNSYFDDCDEEDSGTE